MDDVVGTGPDENLTDNVDMKISLYLTDVVVFRNNGDTGNILGLRINPTTERNRTRKTVLEPHKSFQKG